MKNILKILTVFISVLIFTGCSVDYNLLVTNQKKIIENVTVLESNDKILEVNNSIDDFLLNQKKGFKSNGYGTTNIKNRNSSGLKLTNNYKNFEEYIKSESFTRLFETANIDRDDNIFSFQTTGEYYFNKVFTVDIMSDYIYDLDKITVKIKFYNKVIDSNADSVDEKNNTYIWILDKNNSYDNIMFKLNNSVRYDVMIKDIIYRNKIKIMVGIVLIISIIIGANYLLTIMKKNNSI